MLSLLIQRTTMMLFNSYSFLCFFPIVTLIFFVIPKKARYIWLLAASYYFYMSVNAKYALLLAVSTLTTYFGALALDSAVFAHGGKYARFRKPVFVLCIIVNLGILIFYKYFGFLLGNVNKLLSMVGVSTVGSGFSVVLPVGISFYTFQVLGYLIDVSRGKVRAERNILRYALFVSFFPQLISGPIGRAGSLMPQINNCENIKVWDRERICSGLIIALWGYFQKLVIADRASIFVNEIFSAYSTFGSVELLLGAILYTVQIYCDFSGYSLIALGTAKVIGFDLTENFDAPYFAASVKEFWRRWHISLSTWFRDYLYIPLGGSRCSKLRKYFNLMVTFLVSGLWHGASWSFVVWGAVHGAYQIIGDLLRPVKERVRTRLNVNTGCFSYRLGQVLITDLLVCIAWIFFKMGSFTDALRYILRIITRPDPWVLHNGSLFVHGLDQRQFAILLFAMVLLLIFDALRYAKGLRIDEVLAGQNLWFRWGVIYFILFAVLIYGVYGPTYDASAFIYFQF